MLSPSPKLSLERDESGRSRFQGCSNIREFEFLGKLGEGTFGEVYKARCKRQGSIFALKKILMHNEKDGFPITALREIKLLKMLSHPNILRLQEMAVEKSKGEGRKKPSMYMVMPYMEHDLSGLLENPSVSFTEPQIKCYMLQLLEGVRYLHDSGILHRDMKAANLLISNRGILQVADFGLARLYDEPPPQAGKGGGEAKRDYTPLVVTRWYRPPELLLQLRRYTTAIDMWGIGCVFGEMFKGRPILAGNSDLNQAHLVFGLVGSPTEETMPGWSSLPGCDGFKDFGHKPGNLSQVFREQGPLVVSLLSEFLKLDWRRRITAVDALKHPYFSSPPLPARPGELPHYEDSHEFDRRQFRPKPRPPIPPAGGTGEGNWSTNTGSRSGMEQGNRAPGASRGSFVPRSNAANLRHTADDTLPPKPPHTSQQPWSSNQTRRNDTRAERRKDGHYPPWSANRNDGKVDTYVPKYDAHDKSDAYHDTPTDPARYGSRRDPYNSNNRRRSRSPVLRDKGREDSNYYLYRR
ncbi:putative cyclin-dependent protein kinase Sgv1 [Talaromyces proteolyticus]|uniref:Serine/threonine-protein kinase BUR1 n=1 Tax=Talaromyces proteolyticus TaxID=1131652 RepID=A0AAD4L2H1_9EURO|nr:putative cyclin-dependent protein kinase Sgv1 [Talaromyces proteolyticus]KAH8702645.1 putative cyclin-dependent protein kinase Sgv1 [Talaromyces proteolyticus]